MAEHESDADDKQKSFVKCVKSNHWDDARKYLNDRKAKIDFFHFVVSKDYRVPMWFQEMVDSMEKEDLEEIKISGGFGRTAFYVLVQKHPELVEEAQSMVDKNPKLPTVIPASIFGLGRELDALINPLPVTLAQMSEKGKKKKGLSISILSRHTILSALRTPLHLFPAVLKTEDSVRCSMSFKHHESLKKLFLYIRPIIDLVMDHVI